MIALQLLFSCVVASPDILATTYSSLSADAETTEVVYGSVGSGTAAVINTETGSLTTNNGTSPVYNEQGSTTAAVQGESLTSTTDVSTTLQIGGSSSSNQAGLVGISFVGALGALAQFLF